MAGLDGIRNKIHPGDPMDKDLYDLPPEELKGIPTVCGSLREAIGALEADHEFLLAGDVFSSDQIESYHRAEMDRGVSLRTHPAPGRVRDVLLGLIRVVSRSGVSAPRRRKTAGCFYYLPLPLRGRGREREAARVRVSASRLACRTPHCWRKLCADPIALTLDASRLDLSREAGEVIPRTNGQAKQAKHKLRVVQADCPIDRQYLRRHAKVFRQTPDNSANSLLARLLILPATRPAVTQCAGVIRGRYRTRQCGT